MSHDKSQRPPFDPSSKEAIQYRAARAVIEQAEARLAAEEEAERDEKPGRILVRLLAGILLVLWIIAMTWVAVRSLKKHADARWQPAAFHVDSA